MELREHFDVAALHTEIDRLMDNLEARAGHIVNHEHLREECLLVIGRMQGNIEMLRRLTKKTQPNMDELRVAANIINNAIQVMRSWSLPRD